MSWFDRLIIKVCRFLLLKVFIFGIDNVNKCFLNIKLEYIKSGVIVRGVLDYGLDFKMKFYKEIYEIF